MASVQALAELSVCVYDTLHRRENCPMLPAGWVEIEFQACNGYEFSCCAFCGPDREAALVFIGENVGVRATVGTDSTARELCISLICSCGDADVFDVESSAGVYQFDIGINRCRGKSSDNEISASNDAARRSLA
jgi:hypothetical protein